VRGDRVISLDDCRALPMGIDDGQIYGEATVALERGDLLLLYTDGITEAMAPQRPNAPREMFGVERLDMLLRACGGHGPDACIARIQAELNTFGENGPPKDDQTLVAMRCR
jgi:sigma-B regulation protein RsbU (phosphoserine phosphatase)